MQAIYCSSSEKVTEIIERVANLKEIMESKRENIKQIYYEKEKNSAMLRILNKINKIQEAPNQLNQFLANRQYLSAANLWKSIHQEIFSELLMSIPGLQSIATDWVCQGNMLEEVLQNELTE